MTFSTIFDFDTFVASLAVTVSIFGLMQTLENRKLRRQIAELKEQVEGE